MSQKKKATLSYLSPSFLNIEVSFTLPIKTLKSVTRQLEWRSSCADWDPFLFFVFLFGWGWDKKLKKSFRKQRDC